MTVQQGETVVLLDSSPPTSLFGVASEHDPLWEQVDTLANQESQNKDVDSNANLLVDSGRMEKTSPEA